MDDATQLAEHLTALLEKHAAADLLRTMSACARSLGEKRPDVEDTWAAVATASAQAAEAIDERDEDEDLGGKDEVDEDDEEAEGDELLSPQTGVTVEDMHASLPPVEEKVEVTPMTKGRHMSKDQIAPYRSDATHWRARRKSAAGKTEELAWGPDGIEVYEWPIKQYAPEVLRERWGAGEYVLQFYGTRANGKRKLPLGNTIVIRVREQGDAAQSRVPSPPPMPVAKEPIGSVELLAALAAMRPNPGAGGTDMTAVIQLLTLMDARQDRRDRMAEARFQAERDVMRERDRLQTQERIAQIEANAHVQARGRGGVDQQAIIEALRREVQEALATADDDEDTTPQGPSGPTDYATTITALRETLAPILAALTTKLVADAAADPSLPNPYKSRGNN